MPRGTFFFTFQGNSASSCWSILFFTVERKGEKREQFEGNIVRIFGVVFSVEDKLKTSCPIDKWIVRQRVHCQIYFQKAQFVLVLECRLGAQDFSLRCAMQGGGGALERAVVHWYLQ